MQVKWKMIDRQLRLAGLLYRTFINFTSEKAMRFASKISRKVIIGKTTKKLNCSEKKIKDQNGRDLRICIYKSLQLADHATGVLWIHGGGYALGAPEMDLDYYEKLIQTANCVIVAPDYRPSTEAPYPAALEDCYEALLWMKENTAKLGIRKDQLFIAGDSAGGGMTAALTLYARDLGEVNVAFQMPLYPMLDDRMQTSSMKDNNAPVWNIRNNEVAWKLYLGDLYGRAEIPKYAAPARETDYTELPPTYTFVGDLEPFYDETVTYINRLKEAGVKAEIDIYQGCYHSFDSLAPRAAVSKKAFDKMLAAFKYATENYFDN